MELYTPDFVSGGLVAVVAGTWSEDRVKVGYPGWFLPLLTGERHR